MRRTKEESQNNKKSRLGILGVVATVGIKNMGDGEWEELEMAVESGAGETLVANDALQSVETVEGDAMIDVLGKHFDQKSGSKQKEISRTRDLIMNGSGSSDDMSQHSDDPLDVGHMTSLTNQGL